MMPIQFIAAAPLRFLRLCALPILLTLSLTGQARVVTDDLGREVTVADKVERVVVADIYPLASALTVFLGGPEKIVGIHPVSMRAAQSGLMAELWPQMQKIDTSFMTGPEVNIESLMSVGADVVFVNAANKMLIERLDAARIPALAVSTSKQDYDALATFKNWMQLMESVFPEKSVRHSAQVFTDKIVSLVKERTANIEKRRRVLFLVQYDADKTVVSGRHFFGSFWARAAGAQNVSDDIELKGSQAVVNMEQIYAWQPDAVFITNFTKAVPETLYSNQYHVWSGVKAVDDKAVYKMPLALYRSYTPSGDSPLTLLWVAKTLYPKEFQDVDMVETACRFYQEVFGLTISPDTAARLYSTDKK